MKKLIAALGVLGIITLSVIAINASNVFKADATGTTLLAKTTISNNSGTSGSATQASVQTADVAAPKVIVTSPASNATVSGIVTVSADATDSKGVKYVQFRLDGVNLGTADTTAPYSITWNTAGVANGTHVLRAIEKNNNNVTTKSSTITVTVNNVAVPTPPTVSITAPTNGVTVSGNATISANAGGATAITGVQFKLDGVNLGTADTTAPYSVSWNTKLVSNGTHVLTAVATNTSLLSTTSTSVNVTVNNATAPTVAITAPVAGNVSGTTTVSATAGGTSAITNVQFKLDGVNLGAAATTAPYSVTWNTTGVANGTHTLSAVATNTANLSTTSNSVVLTVNNPVAPTVAITAPVANAVLSGATNTVTATAGGVQAITNVQFKLDGVNLGTAATTAPYSVNFDTTAITNGAHSLTAVATNSANLTTTSAAVAVTVNNVVIPPVVPPAGPNLIANPSVETAQDANTPQSWLASNWGTNTSTFSYLNTGHTGTRSVKVETTAYTNGAANWYYADIPVTPGVTYQYTNWYQSNVDTEVDAEVVMNDGTTQYFYLGTVLSNTNWTKFTNTFTVPAGAKSMAIYQILAKTGYIVSDDYSLNVYTPSPFTRGIVSVSFDDGWTNQHNNANPVMKANGLVGTYNIISGELADQPDYMNVTQIKSLITDGNEIASHTITHPDLTTMTAAQVNQEMSQSQTTLQNTFGIQVTDFAYPFGAYNGSTIATGSLYYQSQRTVNAGYNTKDNFNLTQLKIYEVDSNITQAQVKAWIDGAVANHSWLILVYHEVATTPTDPTDALYDTQPTDFAAEMNYLKSTGVAAETVHQAINEILPQL